MSRNVAAVAACAEQMGASIREISQDGNEAARVAAQAVAEAQSTTETITKLGTSSQEIGAVVKAITSIAEQTNLLALNATIDRKSTRLNSSHANISYAVFCLKKKKIT